ncbi:Uncharacterised protein [Mycobacteroides abscessus subsp. abscessus]|uniref:hypothetical protein n=1 Tax=Mycobacteroides abscessus TaxID=36809 RepID=UPI0009265558|nr:hypothetical protein [Mycobacteroides abscessus]MDO3218038.1 hypothetical protein [Mycobacteroides abscessus subsp. abscessus]SIL89017.1 Uncharacterised protein [Mycobacteroides abscessus subsp. abscessus]SKV03255.1 Uncharacterised protein [Mycobacteroides abscessus subsp. abscessus]SKZ11699.1 Uncharacterised protein [Mycobacteroides abscessus subsp. abscessus]SLE29052.1 Uncharacterised protein [Mycobacteroides abscessus subsp. abscessus]
MRPRQAPLRLVWTLIAAGALSGIAPAPVAYAYESWCDLVEYHAPRIALVSEPLRTSHEQRDIDRLNLFYNRAIPQLNTVAFATFWYPNIWGSPDIRSDTRALLAAMDSLQDLANDAQPTEGAVQDVDNALGSLHKQCDGHRGLPPRPGN